jgi:type IV pilus assembly protein PilC
MEGEMQYKYVAYNQQKQLVNGKLDAPNEAVALDLLNYGGLKIITLKESKPLIDMAKIQAATYKVNTKDVVMFSRQLALMIESGFDITASLDLLAPQLASKAMQKAVKEITADIRNGMKPSQAFAKHPLAFSDLYCRTLAVAEETGNMERALRQMAEHIQKNANTAKKVKGALAYPSFMLLLAFGVVAILAFFVVPQFQKMYDQMDVKLPIATRILLGATDFVRSWGPWIMLLVVIMAVVAFFLTRSEEGKYQRDKIMLGLPLLGRVIVLTELSRVASTISTLFRAGVPLPEVVTLASNSCSNKVIARALMDVRQEMLQGQGLSRPMSQRPVFPALIVQMASVGENTGNLDATMDTVAQSYDIDASERTAAMTGLITPIATLFIGGLVAFVALALVSTMYGMMGSTGQ